MVICAACQSRLAPDAAFCGRCGAAAPPPSAEPLLTMGGLHTDPGQRDDAAVLKEGQVFAGRYEIGGLIGSGGMGSVYRAVERTTGETIALKVIRPDRVRGPGMMQLLVREGAMARRIRHDNVVSVFDVAEEAGAAYLTMELLEGMTLRDWTRRLIAAGEDCSFELAAEIVLQICAGLQAAHAQGVVHRDLKPENVFLLGEPKPGAVRLKLLDFGLARAAGGSTGASGSSAGGTPLYMAPEQKTSPDAMQPSADIYSLSVMFYELLVGVAPVGMWHPPSAGRVDISQAVDALILQGMANRPRSRPQTAEEFRALVRAALLSSGPRRRPLHVDPQNLAWAGATSPPPASGPRLKLPKLSIPKLPKLEAPKAAADALPKAAALAGRWSGGMKRMVGASGGPAPMAPAQAPSAPVTRDWRGWLLWFLWVSGRVGRPAFLLRVAIAAVMFWAGFSWLIGLMATRGEGLAGSAGNPLYWPCFIGLYGSIWLVFTASFQRLHDVGLTGLPALALLAAYQFAVNAYARDNLAPATLMLLFVAVLAVWPGSKRDNRFGPVPR
jgi:uncharacterized membrane protein YhaH (DUF805 family)